MEHHFFGTYIVDESGYVLLPKELRRELKIHKADVVDLYFDGESILIEKNTDFKNSRIESLHGCKVMVGTDKIVIKMRIKED